MRHAQITVAASGVSDARFSATHSAVPNNGWLVTPIANKSGRDGNGWDITRKREVNGR